MPILGVLFYQKNAKAKYRKQMKVAAIQEF